MKKCGNNILLILFCFGILGGLFFPRWYPEALKPDKNLFQMRSLQQYALLTPEYGHLLLEIIENRMAGMLLLFFSCYSAAGLWIMAGTYLACGLSFGYLSALAVSQLGVSGLVFVLCGICPQWFFYWTAGWKMGHFMELRKERAWLCNGTESPVYHRKTMLCFLSIFMLTGLGIVSEVYVNPWLLQRILRLYLSHVR